MERLSCYLGGWRWMISVLFCFDAPPPQPLAWSHSTVGLLFCPRNDWNFLWWTNCTALSQCMCVCVYVKSSPVCWPSWHCYIVGMHTFQTLYYLIYVWLCGNILGCVLYEYICSEMMLLLQFAQRTVEVVFGFTGIRCKWMVEKRVNISLTAWLAGYKLIESVVFFACLFSLDMWVYCVCLVVMAFIHFCFTHPPTPWSLSKEHSLLFHYLSPKLNVTIFIFLLFLFISSFRT